jgi:siroheme synthase
MSENAMATNCLRKTTSIICWSRSRRSAGQLFAEGWRPLLFGRAAEEIRALREAAVEFEIVPGISAGFGAASSARVPLTDRSLASSVLFTTFSRSPEAQRLLRNTLTLDTTVVIYMPGPYYADVSGWLLEAGLPPQTACMLVSKATQSDQAVELTTAAGLADFSPLPARRFSSLDELSHPMPRSPAVSTG